jgi:AsmA protein
MKRALIIVAGVLALLIAAILLVPPLIDLGKYKARYLPLAEQALNRKVDVAEIRLTIVPSPAIRLSELRVADNPAFSSEPFFTAERMSLRLKLGPLLRGRLEAEEFVLEKPVFNLLKKTDGTFNFADIAKKKEDTAKKAKKEAAPKSRDSAKFAHFVPALLRIEDGAVTVRTQGQKPLQISGIDLALKNFSADRPFSYRVALKAPGLKPLSLEGQMRYEETRATLTLLDSRLKAEDADFAVNGTVTELTGAPNVNLSLDNDSFEIKPTVQALAAAEILPKQIAASGPVGLHVKFAGPSNNLLSEIEARMKDLQVNDPRAFKGTVGGKINLTAPLSGDAPFVRRLRGAGRLGAKDGALTNVDLVKRIEQITGLIGMAKEERAGATTFKTMETDFTLAGGSADFKRIYLQSPVMEAEGGGKMNLESQTIDLGIEAALAPGVSARVASAKAATFFKDSQGRVVVPLRIAGPVKGPSVNLDSGKLVKKGLGQVMEKGQGSIFDRLFNRK